VAILYNALSKEEINEQFKLENATGNYTAR
jgi:hypothetical protein